MSDQKTPYHTVYDAMIAKWPQLKEKNSSIIHTWLEAGCHVDKDILRTLEAIKPHPKIKSYNYFTDAILCARDIRLGMEPHKKPVERDLTPDEQEYRLMKDMAFWRKLRGHTTRRPYSDEDFDRLEAYEAKHGKVK